MILKWFLWAILELLISLIAILISPIICLPIFASTKPNKWCSVGEGRETLRGWLQLFSTHDDGIDAAWYKGLYDERIPGKLEQGARDGKELNKYLLRMMWILRNSAYGISHYWFYFKKTNVTTEIRKEKGTWDSDSTNYLYRIDTNEDGQKAFLYRGQFFLFKSLGIKKTLLSRLYWRVQIGWKLTWDQSQVQLATHLNPFPRLWKNNK